jgi:lipoate-protein ligase A
MRRIDTDATGEIWGAIDDTFTNQVYEGTFEPTCVVFHWRENPPALTIAPFDNSDNVDRETIAELGMPFARRYMIGGGHALHVPETPMVQFWYQKEETTLEDEINRAGRACERAMESIGLDATYRPIGDLEITVGDEQVKIIAIGGGSVHFDDFYSITSGSLIWGVTEDFALLDEVSSPPPEKFEDKDTDKQATRMSPVEALLGDLDVEVTRDEAIDALVEYSANELVGVKEVVETDWDPEEEETIQEMRPFFKNDSWVERKSARRMAKHAPPETDIGIAAYKSRKTLQASIILDDDDRILDAQLTGDLYIRPQATITSPGALEQLEDAIVGLDATDRSGLESAIEATYAEYDIESPGIDPTHFARPVTRAAENTESVTEYLVDE